MIVKRIDTTMEATGLSLNTVTADAGYAHAKVLAAFEQRNIDALIPAKAGLIRSPVPLRRFRYDARHNVLKRPRKKILRPKRPLKFGRSFYSRARDCTGCDLASLCL